jgi:hypothetical protein
MKYKKKSPMAEKIGQVFRNSTKKNQLFISNGSREIRAGIANYRSRRSGSYANRNKRSKHGCRQFVVYFK